MVFGWGSVLIYGGSCPMALWPAFRRQRWLTNTLRPVAPARFGLSPWRCFRCGPFGACLIFLFDFRNLLDLIPSCAAGDFHLSRSFGFLCVPGSGPQRVAFHPACEYARRSLGAPALCFFFYVHGIAVYRVAETLCSSLYFILRYRHCYAHCYAVACYPRPLFYQTSSIYTIFCFATSTFHSIFLLDTTC